MGRMYARVRNEQNGAKIMNEVKRNADEAETARRNKIRRACVLAGVGVLILALIYLVYTALAVKKFTVMYNVVLIGALLAFWVLTDIMAPVKAHDFDDRTPEQMGAYKKMAALELIGFAGLYIFAAGAGKSASGNSVGNARVLGAVIFLLTSMTKRKYRDEYLGIAPEKDKNDADSDTGKSGRTLETPAEPMTAANRLERLNKLAAQTPEPGGGPEDAQNENAGAGNTAEKNSPDESSAPGCFTEESGPEAEENEPE